MIPRLLLVASLSSLLSLTVASSKPAERASVNIIATSDLHGYLYPFDYYSNLPANRGLAKAATIIKGLRKLDPNSMLIDCGDTIEGSPLANVYAKNLVGKNPARNPMMEAMNALDYDAMVVGNHEFNFGMRIFQAARKDAEFPWLAANAIVATNADEAIELREKNFTAAAKSVEERVLLPMIFDEVNGVNVAVIGLTTPAVPSFERPENYAAYRFESAVESAKEWVRFARQTRHADVVIIAAHMGLERGIDDGKPFPSQLPGENAIYEIATKVPGIDGIIFGHTHQELAGKSLNGVILAQPKFWGQSVARMTITVERVNEGGPWKVVAKTSEVVPVTGFVEADPEILRIGEAAHLAAQKYLDTPVAEAKSPLDTRLGRVIDTPALGAIHEVQLQSAAGNADISNADISMAAIYDTGVRIPAGPVTVRQLAALYPYENTLIVIDADGQMLRDALEHAASYFGNPQMFGYDYDAAAGVGGNLKYKIDVSKPAGERIVDLQWKGAPLDPKQKLRLAINSYRKAGGGGYTMFGKAQVLWQSATDIRQMMIEHYTAKKTIPARTAADWEIIPKSARDALIAKPQ